MSSWHFFLLLPLPLILPFPPRFFPLGVKVSRIGRGDFSLEGGEKLEETKEEKVEMKGEGKRGVKPPCLCSMRQRQPGFDLKVVRITPGLTFRSL